jgi:stage II sporulation protein D
MRRLPGLAIALFLLAAPAAGAKPYVIHGRGYGHGVGMSQWGAFGFAKHGRTYDWILRHYYSGTTLGTVPGRPIRVLLQSGRPAIQFAGATRAGSASLRAKRTYTARLGAAGVVIADGARKVGTFATPLAVSSSGGAVRLGGVALNGVFDGAYRGSLELHRSPAGGLTAVNVVGLDDYVKGVVPGEVPAKWPAEALKAQAVAARSYALTTDAGGALYDQFPDTRSQVYRGMDGEADRTSAAVEATAGQVVRYDGETAVTYFFSASGGRTEDVENVFYASEAKPYLRGVGDAYDGAAPRHEWTVKLTTAQVQSRLAGLVRGSFRGIRVVESGSSPRIVWADVVGSGGTIRVRGATLKARLGLYDTWASFPSFGSRRERGLAALPVAIPVPVAAEPAPAAPGPAPAQGSSAGADRFRWPGAAWDSRSAGGG